ncbi:hypothetical protein FJZ33_06900, partial [Candidatus Poribacteria bacterium]|nr:hypothetical protein [Candidatus Poribacteria bacterium]
MGFLQSLANLLFFLIIAGTVIFSIWLSRKYKERYAEFPWYKAGIIIALEVVAWVVFNWFFSFLRAYPWLAAIVISV